MALADLSFKLYTDAGLTVEYGGTTTLTHESDLSDNPQDIQLWFGSQLSNRILQTQTNPSVDNVTLTPTDILPAWVANTVYTAGQSVEPTVDNGYRYVVTFAGTSDAVTEPTWPTAVGATVIDSGVTWTCVAQTHEPTEIRMALTQGTLGAATAGGLINLGTSISGGSVNAVEFWIRVENTVVTVSNNAGNPEIALYINAVIETAV